jgi:hypothetical protein
MSTGRKTVLEVVNLALGRLRMAPLATTAGSVIGNLMTSFLQEVLDEMEASWVWTDLLDTIQIVGDEVNGSFYLPSTGESSVIEGVWNDTNDYRLKQTTQADMNIMRRSSGSESRTGIPDRWATNGHDPVTGELNIDFWPIPSLGTLMYVDVRSPHEDVQGKDATKVRLPNRAVVAGVLWKYQGDSKGYDNPVTEAAKRVYDNALRDAIAIDGGQQPGRTDWVPS